MSILSDQLYPKWVNSANFSPTMLIRRLGFLEAPPSLNLITTFPLMLVVACLFSTTPLYHCTMSTANEANEQNPPHTGDDLIAAEDVSVSPICLKVNQIQRLIYTYRLKIKMTSILFFPTSLWHSKFTCS